MNKINKHPYSKINFNNVVYLGAGNGDGLEELINALNAKHWTLIEGNEKKARQLASTVSQLNNKSDINVKQAIVSAKGGEQTWYNYNLNEFSGLKQASGLKELFPGLKLQGSQPIETEALSTLLAEISGKETGGNNALIIDLPGYGTELIEALQNSGELQHWPFLAITAPESVLFDQGDDAEKLQQKLTDLNYHTRGETGNDPDFPVLYYVMSEAQQKLVAERDTAIAEKDEALARVSSATKDQEKLKQQLNEKNKQADGAKARVKELEQALEESNKVIDETEARATDYSKELHKQLEELKQKTEEYEKLRKVKVESDNDYKKELSNLKRALDGKSEVLQQKEQELENYKRMEANYNREFYRAESQLELLKELMSNGKG